MGEGSSRIWRGAALLGCVLAFVTVVAAPVWGDEAVLLYDSSTVAEIDLGLPQSSIEALEAEPDEYQPATVELSLGNKTYGPYEVGTRPKGGLGSFRPLTGKAGFKVKFDEYVDGQTFLGIEKLTLNSMVQDPSMVHETLTYRLFRSLDLPAPRTGYAFVRVNGEPYGVYLNVETLDSISLPRWFATTRHLYEAQVGLDVSLGAAPLFEVDEGKGSKREDLEALIVAANDDAGDWSDGMAAVADLSQMTRMWAVERYIGHWDGYAGAHGDIHRPNNYYLHSVESGLFQMLPWGTDQTWAMRMKFDDPAGGLLFNECFADDSCQALYLDALEAVQAAAPALELERQASCLARQLAPWQQLEVEPRREHGAAAIAAAVGQTRDFVADRPGELAAWLGVDEPEQPAEEICPPADLSSPTARVVVGPAPASSPRPSGIRLRRIAIDGGQLKARVSLPSAGRLRLDAWVGSVASGRRACRGRSQALPPGPAVVQCELHGTAFRRLRAGTLRLTAKGVFVAHTGLVQRAVRTVELPRR